MHEAVKSNTIISQSNDVNPFPQGTEAILFLIGLQIQHIGGKLNF